jgi:hypothetical protein
MFDPIQEIPRVVDQNRRRDDALNMARFSKENQVVDNRELKDLGEALIYAPVKRMKLLSWDGQ